MSEISTANPEFIREAQLAERWGMSVKSIQRWRYSRLGPDYLKMIGRVVYRMTEVEHFEAQCLHKMGIPRSDPSK